jgi:hypothetical protein
MKYGSIRRWHAELKLVARLILCDFDRKHKITACEACLRGDVCPEVQHLLKQADRIPEE